MTDFTRVYSGERALIGQCVTTHMTTTALWQIGQNAGPTDSDPASSSKALLHRILIQTLAHEEGHADLDAILCNYNRWW